MKTRLQIFVSELDDDEGSTGGRFIATMHPCNADGVVDEQEVIQESAEHDTAAAAMLELMHGVVPYDSSWGLEEPETE